MLKPQILLGHESALSLLTGAGERAKESSLRGFLSELERPTLKAKSYDLLWSVRWLRGASHP